jgi:probable DNA metabolism protein
MTYTVGIRQQDDLDEFRQAARRLLAARVAPSDVAWSGKQAETLFAEALPGDELIVSVPRSFRELARAVVCHRNDQRWSLLYQLLWRISQGERMLMQQEADPLVHRLRRMATAIKHDQHRMTAFVRFRAVPDPDGEIFVAWYEPQHHILRRTASFFIDRFANMRFSILTPDIALHWDGVTERFISGLTRHDAASEDKVEAWWSRYYAATFNPARINARLMQSHMPKHFWRNLPEAKAIAELIGEAGARTDRMIRTPAPAR